MKHKVISSILITALCLLGSAAWASTGYVNGVSGSDSNNCTSPSTACKTIGHAISLASSGDSIIVAAATYTKNLTITFSLNIVGSGAPTTIVDGGRHGTVVTISNKGANVTLSTLTIRNGLAAFAGGIYNTGALTINNSTVSGNQAFGSFSGYGGGIYNAGTAMINHSTVSGNSAFARSSAWGGGINNFGTVTMNNSTLTGNTTGCGILGCHTGGGGINNGNGNLTINNSTLSGNIASLGGGIYNTASTTIQNSVIANSSRGNCRGTITSNGYNLSSDGTCNFNGPGDLNNTDPMLGPLQNNGGPTQTMALPSGSPAVDAGNPSGCTDGSGHLLKTDQRGKPRPDTEDIGGCDMGAYERQSD